ncbi:hypothetical protein HY249_02985, partial [Candidatus Azambacteria bacterium]|nr:hypothetical protein [Candidatus Azambacteria bacterium]
MTNEEAIKKIARILRTDKNTVAGICERMEDVTGTRDVPQRVMEENEVLVEKALTSLGVRKDAFHYEIYNALIGHIKGNDEKIFKLLREPRCINFEGCKTLLNFAQEISGVPEGFFMKRSKAEELLRNQPPLNIISALGYKDVNELIEKEELYQIFSALRFLEDMEWLNKVFFAQYKNLTVDDFEFRPIEVKVLDGKWMKAAEKFLK